MLYYRRSLGSKALTPQKSVVFICLLLGLTNSPTECISSDLCAIEGIFICLLCCLSYKRVIQQSGRDWTKLQVQRDCGSPYLSLFFWISPSLWGNKDHHPSFFIPCARKMTCFYQSFRLLHME